MITPKYWMGHDLETGDIYLDTAHKGYDGAYQKMTEVLGQEWESISVYSVDLFSLNLVEAEDQQEI